MNALASATPTLASDIKAKYEATIAAKIEAAVTPYKKTIADLQKKNSELATQNSGLLAQNSELVGVLSELIGSDTVNDILNANSNDIKSTTSPVSPPELKLVDMTVAHDTYLKLNSTISKKSVLVGYEIDALMQVPAGTSDLLKASKKLPDSCTYEDVLVYLNKIFPAGVKIIPGFTILNIHNVADILDTSKEVVFKLHTDGNLKGAILPNGSLVFTKQSVLKYFKNLGKTPKLTLIPHLFYKAMYATLHNNLSFTDFFKIAFFGFEPYSNFYDPAIKIISSYDPVMGKYLNSFKGKKGDILVRSFMETYKKDIVAEAVSLGEEYDDLSGVKFLSKYCLYDVDGNLVFTSDNPKVVSVVMPIKAVSNDAEFAPPYLIGELCGLGKHRSVRVNECLAKAGLQSKNAKGEWELSVICKTMETPKGEPIARKNKDSTVVKGKLIDTSNWHWHYETIKQYITEKK